MDIITYSIFEPDTDAVASNSFFSFFRRANNSRSGFSYTPNQAKRSAASAVFIPRYAGRKNTVRGVSFNFSVVLLKVRKLFPLLAAAGIAVCILSGVFAVQRGMSLLGFRKIGFVDEPSMERALQSYVFPDQAEFADAETAIPLESYVPLVTFQTHVVKSGETISGIAARFGLKNMGSILAANGITNARRISTGQKLRIPSTDGLLYTVGKEETLAGIAERYHVSVTALLDANDLPDSLLRVGQQLFIPGAALSTFELRRALGDLFIYPIKGRLTSPFGYRKDPFTGVNSFHSGIDLAAPQGTAIKAVLDGRVLDTGTNRIFGNYVVIRHERGYQSLYGHMETISAKKGQRVSQGAVIGTVGNTGYSTGPHVHLSIYKNGNLIDPFSVLK